MENQQYSTEPLSSGTLLREIGRSVKDLVHSEVNLVTLELKESGEKATQDLIRAIAFGSLLALSALPFLAFLVIGLGQLLGDRYWLSSLIVAVTCAGVGGPMALKFFKKISEVDFKFPRTRRTFTRSAESMKQKIENVRDAAKGEKYDNIQIH